MRKNSFVYIVTYITSQLQVAPLKNLFFLAVLQLVMKNSFGYNKEIESMEESPYNTDILYVKVAWHVFY